MRQFYLRGCLLGISFLVLMLISVSASATHIRAGEITARRIDPQSFTYEITLTGYADRDSQVLFGSNGTLDYGDGTYLQLANDGDDIPRTAISNDTWKYELKVRHTFQTARSYVISFREFYRNDGILNMDNSVNMPFYVETVVVIDPFLGVNNTPQLLVPPIDKAGVGKIYTHNPGAYDVDGDSLSFSLVVSRQDRNNAVANYRYPQNTFPAGDPRNGKSLAGGDATITLNPITGNLVWNTPGTAGEYNMAVKVEEWRKIKGKYYHVGYVIRDWQIIVAPTDNELPIIEIPEEICVVAGERIEKLIKVTDPNGENIELVAFGGVFNLGATFPGGTNLPTPASSTFTWQTACADVRSQPYQVVFRARDLRGGGVSLTDIKTLSIRVVGPPPATPDITVVNDKSIQLNFNTTTYPCREAPRIQVWRSAGSTTISADICTSGMPAGNGYQLVDTREVNNFPFTDDNKGAGLEPGATFCYKYVTVYPDPQGGKSLVSEERCLSIPAKMPLITNVHILKTSETNGEILVKWVPGPDLATGEVPQPYKYDLYRSAGITGGTPTLVAQQLTTTEFKDSGLNTKENIYNYYVVFKDANGAEFNRSSSASSVRLTPVSETAGIRLEWQAAVAWAINTNQYPLHDIYRNRVNAANPDEMVLIAKVNVVENGFRYLDTGVDAGTGELLKNVEYCYQIVTSGSYNNPKAPDPLINSSQTVCATTKPAVLNSLEPATKYILNMYPNPLSGKVLTLNIPEAVGKAVQFKLYDAKGQVVQQENIWVKEPEHLLEINSLEPGIYLLHLQNNGRLYRNKLIIQ